MSSGVSSVKIELQKMKWESIKVSIFQNDINIIFLKKYEDLEAEMKN